MRTIKVEIWVSYNYGMHTLSFSKTFDWPFAPFYNMILEDGENGLEIELENREGISTRIYFEAKDNSFYIQRREYWRHGVSDDTIDYYLEEFPGAGWKREDSEDINKFKNAMKAKSGNLN